MQPAKRRIRTKRRTTPTPIIRTIATITTIVNRNRLRPILVQVAKARKVLPRRRTRWARKTKPSSQCPQHRVQPTRLLPLMLPLKSSPLEASVPLRRHLGCMALPPSENWKTTVRVSHLTSSRARLRITRTISTRRALTTAE